MGDCLIDYSNTFMRIVHKTVGLIFITCAPIIITANALLIASFIATKQSLKNTSKFLMACLSISDCLTGIILMPGQFVMYFWYDSGSCPLKFMRLIFPNLHACFTSNSMLITILLALDRYLHMNPDFCRSRSRLAKMFERPRIYVLTLIITVFSTASSFALYFIAHRGQYNIAYVTAYYTVAMLTAMTLILVIYARGFLRIRQFVAESMVYANEAESGTTEGPRYLHELYKTVLLLLVAMFVSWAPYFILNGVLTVMYFVNKMFPPWKDFYLYAMVSYLLLYSNAVTNVLIIFYRNEKSKEWLLKNVVSLCRKQRNELEAPNNS